MEKKTAIKFLWVVGLVVLAGSAKLLYWKYRLSKEGVYVIGRRTYLSTGGETGPVYNYKFLYRGTEFEVGQSGSMPYRGKDDTLLFLKILPADPDGYCDYMTDAHVPKCFGLRDVPYDGWKEIPRDTCIIDKP